MSKTWIKLFETEDFIRYSLKTHKNFEIVLEYLKDTKQYIVNAPIGSVLSVGMLLTANNLSDAFGEAEDVVVYELSTVLKSLKIVGDAPYV